MTKSMLTQEILKELLHYDPDTGVFTWRYRGLDWFDGNSRVHKTWNTRYSNQHTGCQGTGGYLYIRMFGRCYVAHRLAYLYMYGHMPKNVLHDDQTRRNNKISNLMAGTPAENSKNLKMSDANTSGFVGVCWHKKIGKWQAQVKVKKKNIFLGYFEKIEDAIAARKSANHKYGFHRYHGRSAA